MRLPDRVFARALVLRSLLVWFVLRAALAGLAAGSPGGAGLQDPATLLVLDPFTLLFLAGVVLATIMIDARARKEDQFLAGLGTSRAAMGVAVITTVAVAEAAVIAFAMTGVLR